MPGAFNEYGQINLHVFLQKNKARTFLLLNDEECIAYHHVFFFVFVIVVN